MLHVGLGLVDMARWLLHHGADLNPHSIECWTSLHAATYHRHLEITRVLLQHNPDINLQAYLGFYLLHLVAGPFRHRDVGIMQLLLDHGVDPKGLWIMMARPHSITRHGGRKKATRRAKEQSKVRSCFSSMEQTSVPRIMRVGHHHS